MNVVLVHRYFWPTPYPYADMLREIAESFVAAGHRVTVVAPADDAMAESERLRWASAVGVTLVQRVIANHRDSGRVRKVWDYFGYLRWLAGALRSLRADLYWVATTPPVIAAAVVRRHAGRSSAGYVYHCQDIHPEASIALGSIGSGIPGKFLCAVDRRNVDHASRVVVLSSDMRDSLARRGQQVRHVEVINNYLRDELAGIDACGDTALGYDAGAGPSDDTTDTHRPARWIFAGSLGRFQSLDLLVESFLAMNPLTRPELTILGGGPLLDELRQRVLEAGAEGAGICLRGQVSPVEAQRLMMDHDAGIVSLAPGIINLAYPSKSINYLGSGLKLVCLLDEHSELARFVEREDVGWASSACTASSLATDLSRIAPRSVISDHERARVRSIARKYFGAQSTLDRYVDVLEAAK